MRILFPREGGVLTLWFSGLAIGLSFIIERGVLLAGFLYLAGSLLLLASTATVEEFIRRWRGKSEVRPQLLIPPVLGFAAWGLVLSGNALAYLIPFVLALAFVSVRFIQKKEREWQTRIGFTAAVLFMALLGLSLSGAELDPSLATLLFLVPFTFFSAQELFVQHIAENRRLSSPNPGPPGLRGAVRLRKFALFAFLIVYAIVSAATLPFAPSMAFPVVFELFLIGFPTVWLTSGKASFTRLGIEQASLDALMVIATVAFAVSR